MAKGAKTLVVMNQKGGAGKTTAAVNLAGEFAAMGFTACLFDTDPQRSLSSWLSAGGSALSAHLRPLPYTPDHADPKRRAFPVKAFTAAVTDAVQTPGMDYVVIDTPPSLNGDAALAACLLADLIVIPVRPSAVDVRASDSAIATALEAVDGDKTRVALVPYGLVSRTASSKDLPELLAGSGLTVLPAINHREAVAKAAISGLSLAEYQPNSPARLEFSALAAAVNKALKKSTRHDK